MIAAAQCPKCSHLFELRDGFGELVPLAYCSTCESYYPESAGECRWCHTKPEHAPRAPLIWRGAGAVAFVGIVATAWILRDNAAKRTTSAQVKTVASAVPTTPKAPDTTANVVPQATVAPALAQQAPVVAVVDTAAAAPAPTPAPLSAPAAVAPTPRVAVAPTAPPTRQPARWVTSVSRRWVVIRTGASKESRIVASIGPNSRVQLGETRGTWRRIRAQGLNGWVEAADSFGPR